jgi:plasmid stability protein
MTDVTIHGLDDGVLAAVRARAEAAGHTTPLIGQDRDARG